MAPDFVRASPEEAHRALIERGAQLVDVRELSEVDAVRVEGALNLPLSRLAELAGALDKGRPVFLLCRSGSRAASAAAALSKLGAADVRVVEGGLDAWTAAGRPVVRGASRVWALERQVRFAAGLLVLAGVLLGAFLHPGFYALAGFVGAGLTFSGATDICGMALLLARMPWNRRKGGGTGSC